MTVINARSSSRRRFKVMLIDLDDTLYRVHEIPGVVRHRIEEYMVHRLGVPADEVGPIQTDLYLKHGTTLAGLVASGHKIDYDDWHRFVHYGSEAINYERLLHPDPELRELLCSIDIPKYILTNADRVHTKKCLDRLGISDCFKGQFYFENVHELAQKAGFSTSEHDAVLCKPMPATYKLVAQAIGVNMSDIIFLDDSARNVASAQELGAFTVLVGRDEPCPGANVAVSDLHQLPTVMPELFDQPGEVKDDHGHGYTHIHGGHHVADVLQQQQQAVPVPISALAS